MTARKGLGLTHCAAIAVGFALVVMLGSTPAEAQEWSAAQKDVWKSVEAYWDVAGKRDFDGFMGYFDKDYLGWENGAPLPGDKKLIKAWVMHDFETTKEILHSIQPVGIVIHGDVAIVHYYYSVLEKNAKGEDEASSGRWTDILVKSGDRWVLLADHGGRTSGDED